ncbi:universal stress protein [Agreia sp. COWG]|uniref:universal stress protein n=1 Tax=Agreia sp. COWG TaxID=2773266 RepID=UPI001AF1A831|nr:universal stress protein [Agreia sp. COWG]CAD6007100.1 Usp domain-containing protein [Agreia sp. COWG]
MSRRANYVVAYEATERGREAIELGVALARLTDSELRICLVLPQSTSVPAKVPNSAADFVGIVAQQAQLWLDEAAAFVPADVDASTHLLWAESTSEGLIEAATSFDSDRIVVGAARTGILRRFTIGSVANALLHASPVPVALAPRGYRAPEQISRITCAIGTRPGWQALLDSMVAISEDLEVELRFVTLVEVDAGSSRPVSSDAHLLTVLDYFSEREKTRGILSTEVAEGPSVEAAVEALGWRDDEIAFVGSSRLASPSRIFLGTTANRMLHSLPVPLIVVPNDAV